MARLQGSSSLRRIMPAGGRSQRGRPPQLAASLMIALTTGRAAHDPARQMIFDVRVSGFDRRRASLQAQTCCVGKARDAELANGQRIP
jgi:hypothetical protein